MLTDIHKEENPNGSRQGYHDFRWMSKGCVILVETEEQLEIAKKQYREKIEDGVRVRFMDRYKVHEDEPNTTPDIPGSLEFPEGGSLNPMLFAFALAKAVREMGGKILRYTEVTDIEKNKTGTIRCVLTNRGDVSCE